MQGKCDASVLLKGNSTTKTELDSATNLTLRGLDFIDFLKSMLTKANCTQVSCADIIALSARDAVVAVSGLTSLPYSLLFVEMCNQLKVPVLMENNIVS